MKKILITVILSLALLLILPISAFADTGKYVVDNGNLLNNAEEAALEEKLEAISEMYDFDGCCNKSKRCRSICRRLL